MSSRLDPDRSLWHFIAVEVRRQRELHGLSGNRLAAVLGCDRSTVSRIENGLRRLSTDYASRLDDLWGTSNLFTRLVRFASASDDGDWFTGLTDHEARATRHRMWEALLIPGLLQTPEYARAVLASGLLDGVDEALEKRMARQTAVYSRPKPPLLSVILNWVVLEQMVGDPATMHAQLAHLLEVGELPHVSIRVLDRSAGAHIGLNGSFTLLTVDDQDIAFADAPERGRLMIDPADVQTFAAMYDRISDVASPVGPSRTLIESIKETYK
ncbi:helix-turn-helix domain-containing protein [Spirillospora sp. CA-108201]